MLLKPRELDTLDVGVALDVEQLLATQPSELQALTADMTGDELRELVDRGRAAWPRTRAPTQPSSAAAKRHALMVREQTLLRALTRYLDELYDRVGQRSDPDGAE